MALSTLVSLGLAEAVARRTEQEPWWEAVTNEQLAIPWQEYPLNSQRLRDREYTTPRPSGHHRLLFLGDSFTFGSGIRDGSQIFVELLEERLNADRPDPRVERYDLLNAGIPGSLTEQWREAYRRTKDTFDPQEVVVVFFLRDGTRLGFEQDFFGPLRDELREWRRSDPIARRSALWRTLRGKALARRISTAYVEAFHTAYFGDESQTEEWRDAQSWLRTLRDDCAASGRRLHLVVFPVLFGLQGNYPFADVCTEIERFGREAKIDTHSLLPAYRGRDDRSLWVSAYDQHPNALGHRIAADALEAILRPALEARAP